MRQRRNTGIYRSWIANTIGSNAVISDELDAAIDFIGMGITTKNGVTTREWGMNGPVEHMANCVIDFFNTNHNLNVNDELNDFIQTWRKTSQARNGRFGCFASDSLNNSNTVYISGSMGYDLYWFLDDYDFTPWYPLPEPEPEPEYVPAPYEANTEPGGPYGDLDPDDYEVIEEEANTELVNSNLIEGLGAGLRFGYDLNEERFTSIQLWPRQNSTMPTRLFTIAANNQLSLAETMYCGDEVTAPTEQANTYPGILEKFHNEIDDYLDVKAEYNNSALRQRVNARFASITNCVPAKELAGMSFAYLEMRLNSANTASSANTVINNKYKLPEGSTWTPQAGLFNTTTHVANT